MDINAKTATDIIETIRMYLAERTSAEAIEKDLESRFGIKPGPKVIVRSRMPKA